MLLSGNFLRAPLTESIRKKNENIYTQTDTPQQTEKMKKLRKR